jgi:hypothetical protein
MLATWLAYIIALIQAIGSHFFIANSGGFVWEKMDDNTWSLVNATLPQLNPIGKEFVDSLVTIYCNGMTFLAQASALLAAHPGH